MTDSDDIRYQEALRRYQVEIAQYEEAAHLYKLQLQDFKEGDPRPRRPIPPIPPMRTLKLVFVEAEDAKTDFNAGVEAAALALESVGEKDFADWVRRQKRDP